MSQHFEGRAEESMSGTNNPDRSRLKLDATRYDGGAEALNVPHGFYAQSSSGSNSQHGISSPFFSESSTPFLSQHAGNKLPVDSQVKQGHHSNLYAAPKVSKFMRSHNLDSSPTQTLLSVANEILSESIDKKSGEIPQRVAILLKNVVQEIERRISTQAEHIRNQNNIFKAREEKYLSRIKVLETLASGTIEETQTTRNQQQLMKIKGAKNMEKTKSEDQEVGRLIKEKEAKDHTISILKQELETANKSYQYQCQHVESETKDEDHTISTLRQEIEIANKSYQYQCQHLESVAKDKDHTISILKQQLETANTYQYQCQHLESETKDKDRTISMLKKELEKANKSHQYQLESEADDKDHTISELKKELETANKSYQHQLENETKDKDHAISMLKQELEKTNESYQYQLESETKNKDHTISILKQELETMNKSYQYQCQNLENETKDKDNTISILKQELEEVTKSYQYQCQHLESETKEIKLQLEQRSKEFEFLLEQSTKKAEELEAISRSKFQAWSKKERFFQNFIGFQLQAVQNLRIASSSTKECVVDIQSKWSDEMTNFAKKLKVPVEAAENYHTVLAENKRLHNEVQELKGNIRVCCRIRPFLPGENGRATIVDSIGENGELLLVNPSKQGKDKHRTFKFNKVFGPAASQAQVFLDIQPLIRSVLDGYNVCIFAYGQTGSGKTYTMTGPNSPSEEEWGVNYRALNDLFHISQNRSAALLYEVGVQMVEIYNEQVRDLLSTEASQKKLGIRGTSLANGLAVPDASMEPVKSTSDVLQLMEIGFANRAVSSTALNQRSSRSHSILTVHVRCVELKTGLTSNGCLHLIDLAGSERVDRSEVTGDRLKEAQHINKSLSALGDVIFALAQKSAHVPYRNSKLTQVLHSSLGGQAKTLMFVQINPDVESYSESLSTLKFAERVSGVELGAARSNKEGKDVTDLMEQVASLKDTIARKDEEIEQLQQLKYPGMHSPRMSSGKHVGSPLRHSSSSPGPLSLESGPQLSTDDIKQQGNFSQTKFNGEEATNDSLVDNDPSGDADAESEDKSSDTSDTGLSVDTTGSTNSLSEHSTFPVPGKKSESATDNPRRVTPRVSKPLPLKTGALASSKVRLKEPVTSPRTRKTTTIQAATSSTRLPKRG